MATLVGPGVNHDRRGKTGMPNGTVLTKMMNAAEGLRLKPATRTQRGGIADGISFHIALYVPGGSPLSITDVFVDHKTGAAVCYENTLFTDAMVAQISGAVSDIVICQSVAPCTRCRAGYSQLARNAERTIVISSDDGYDGAPPPTQSSCFPPPDWCSTETERLRESGTEIRAWIDGAGYGAVGGVSAAP